MPNSAEAAEKTLDFNKNQVDNPPLPESAADSLPPDKTPLRGGGQIFDQGGSPLPQEINPEDIVSLKRLFLEIDPEFIFDNAFYRRACGFLAANNLDSEYCLWVYQFCRQKSPRSLVDYFYKVFFELRLAELYQKLSRPPPAVTVHCPVCSAEHGAAYRECPQCGVQSGLHPDDLKREKQLYAMPQEQRKNYEDELAWLIQKTGLNLEERNSCIKELEEKYSLAYH
jgi:hypothetical protein